METEEANPSEAEHSDKTFEISEMKERNNILSVFLKSYDSNSIGVV